MQYQHASFKFPGFWDPKDGVPYRGKVEWWGTSFAHVKFDARKPYSKIAGNIIVFNHNLGEINGLGEVKLYDPINAKDEDSIREEYAKEIETGTAGINKVFMYCKSTNQSQQVSDHIPLVSWEKSEDGTFKVPYGFSYEPKYLELLTNDTEVEENTQYILENYDRTLGVSENKAAEKIEKLRKLSKSLEFNHWQQDRFKGISIYSFGKTIDEAIERNFELHDDEDVQEFENLWRDVQASLDSVPRGLLTLL